MSSNRSFRRTFLCGAAIGALTLSGAAWAQDADPETDAAEEIIEIAEEVPGEARQEKITVTGSLLQRDEFSSASPIQVITAEVASLEGLVDAATILQGSSLAAGSTQINNQFGGFVVDGGTGVNTVDLRGCGTTRTLVLINGKRPGPSGVRGAVGAFDFNNIPGSIVQRYDILKDSGSTIYGSDAVCGVVNVITRTSIDKPEINFSVTKPFDTGGELYSIDGAYGFNLENGNISLAASYRMNEDLSLGDREFLNCDQDLVTDPATGQSVDRLNRSVTNNGGQRNCGNIYFNTVLDRVFGDRLIPSPDGRVLPTGSGGTVAGYRPRENGPLVGDPLGRSFYEDVLEDPRYLTEDAINKSEIFSAYAVADFDFDALGGINWVTEGLFTNRKTTSEGWRQFFPDIRGNTTFFGGFFGYANDPLYDNPLNTVALPVTIWPSNSEVDIDYMLVQTTLSGDFGNAGFLSDFAWSLGGNYSKSDGDLTRNQIIASRTGDWSLSDDAPDFDYFDPGFLAGTGPVYDAAYAALTENETGNTEYSQWLINGNIAGELFELPAGAVGGAIGFEVREYEITDTPGPFTLDGDLWGFTTSGITTGTETVSEVFGELEIPILKGQKFAEELTLNLSGRAFDYETSGSDSIYKIGLNWQMNPSLRLRATKGTSFRAPALFETYLDAQTSFTGQFGIDPCIEWGESQNGNIRANCAAEGIPDDFQNLGASARVISGGNGDTLLPETSDSFTAGVVFTPTFADFNIAVDYFEFEIDDQIGQLGAGSILAACYGGEPAQFATNAFCDLFERAPANDASAPFAIDNVLDTFLNINSQLQRGIDLETRYERDFDFGSVVFDAGGTWTLESLTSLFAPGTVDGIENNDSNGSIGDPSFVADGRISLERGNYTYTWFTNYVGNTSNNRFADTPDGIGEPYFGLNANVDYTAEAVFYHGASVRWEGDSWTFTGGVRNLFDETPPTVSSEAATVRGNFPLVATQYDLRGRRAFMQVSKTF
jgi:iron complex outermembrane receptor protein